MSDNSKTPLETTATGLVALWHFGTEITSYARFVLGSPRQTRSATIAKVLIGQVGRGDLIAQEYVPFNAETRINMHA